VRITRLAIADWRNLSKAELTTDARFVILHGDNAQGKTNLLEAVWMLAALRSFRESQPRRLVKEGSRFARVEAQVVGPYDTRRLELRLLPGKRRLRVDDVAPTSLGSWFELLRAILFCPDHIRIVRGVPQERRDFLDRAIFTVSPGYLELAADYRRAVQQKAALLRTGQARPAELAPWNDRIVQLGARIALARHAMVETLRPHVLAASAEMSGPAADARTVELQLRSLGGEELGLSAVAERIEAAIARFGEEERRRGRVLVGPHRDDLQLRVEGRNAADYASQGQARTLVLALKLAELAVARSRGVAPLLLVDDLTGELDRGRMQRFLALLTAQESQVWITTTDPAFLGPLPAGEARFWRVREGQVWLEKGSQTG